MLGNKDIDQEEGIEELFDIEQNRFIKVNKNTEK